LVLMDTFFILKTHSLGCDWKLQLCVFLHTNWFFECCWFLYFSKTTLSCPIFWTVLHVALDSLGMSMYYISCS
jgi:hypothetical protein